MLSTAWNRYPLAPTGMLKRYEASRTIAMRVTSDVSKLWCFRPELEQGRVRCFVPWQYCLVEIWFAYLPVSLTGRKTRGLWRVFLSDLLACSLCRDSGVAMGSISAKFQGRILVGPLFFEFGYGVPAPIARPAEAAIDGGRAIELTVLGLGDTLRTQPSNFEVMCCGVPAVVRSIGKHSALTTH